MERVGGLRPVERIPSTGLSEVYRTEEGPVLKVLGREASGRADLRARVAAMRGRWPERPGFVRVLDEGEDAGRLFVALEPVEAESLREAVRREGPLAPVRLVEVIEPVAALLDQLDLAGVTYADTKTGNVLLHPDARVTLAHSWLSFPHQGDTAGFAAPDQFAGTIDYVAPEVIEGSLPDLRSDVYGLACTVFECLTGRVPFPRASEDETLDAHLHGEPPASPFAERPVRRAMAKDPRERHPTAGSLAADLRAALS